jgi:flavin reductase (DIM6/NTAB) family NADH-FMN oxidoreductase RutF
MSGEGQQAATTMEEAEFRRVLGHLASGVTVVTSAVPEGPAHGLTATAVTSLSLDPPLVLVCVDRAADTRGAIQSSGAFAINVLGEDDEGLARRFATYPVEEKFEGVAYREESTGSPILGRALAWIDCRLRHVYEGGDHEIFVGEVVACDAREGSPLLYFRGGYGRLTP